MLQRANVEFKGLRTSWWGNSRPRWPGPHSRRRDLQEQRQEHTRRIWETLSAPMHGAGEEEEAVNAVMLLGDQTM